MKMKNSNGDSKAFLSGGPTPNKIGTGAVIQ